MGWGEAEVGVASLLSSNVASCLKPCPLSPVKGYLLSKHLSGKKREGTLYLLLCLFPPAVSQILQLPAYLSIKSDVPTKVIQLHPSLYSR